MPTDTTKPIDVEDLLFSRFDRGAWDAARRRYDCWTIGAELYRRYDRKLPTREDLAREIAAQWIDPDVPREPLFDLYWSRAGDVPLPMNLPPLACLVYTMLPLHVGWVIWSGRDFLHIQQDSNASIEPIHSPAWRAKILEVRVLKDRPDDIASV